MRFCALRLSVAYCKFSYLFIPIKDKLLPEYKAAYGVTEQLKADNQIEWVQLMNTIALVRQRLNPNLNIEGVVITLFDGRALISKQIAAEIKKFFKNKLYEVIIPRNVRLAEAPSHGKPIMLYDSKCAGARAYKALTEEFLSKQ